MGACYSKVCKASWNHVVKVRLKRKINYNKQKFWILGIRKNELFIVKGLIFTVYSG